MSVDEILLPSKIEYNINVCIVVDYAEVQVQIFTIFFPIVSAENLSLAVDVTVETGLYPQTKETVEILEWTNPTLDLSVKANGTVEIIEWTDAVIDAIIQIPADNLEGVIEDELTKTLSKYLDEFIQIDNNMSLYTKGQF
nr:hypothetical transcript [Hymenolepis microstoma]